MGREIFATITLENTCQDKRKEEAACCSELDGWQTKTQSSVGEKNALHFTLMYKYASI